MEIVTFKKGGKVYKRKVVFMDVQNFVVYLLNPIAVLQSGLRSAAFSFPSLLVPLARACSLAAPQRGVACHGGLEVLKLHEKL